MELICLLASGGIDGCKDYALIYTMPHYLKLWLWILGIAALSVPAVLVFYGEIGPRWLRDLMRRYQRWNWGDASPLLPLDPYKPASEILNEQDDPPPPLRRRVKNSFLQWAIAWGIGILIAIILFGLVVR